MKPCADLIDGVRRPAPHLPGVCGGKSGELLDKARSAAEESVAKLQRPDF